METPCLLSLTLSLLGSQQVNPAGGDIRVSSSFLSLGCAQTPFPPSQVPDPWQVCWLAEPARAPGPSPPEGDPPPPVSRWIPALAG